MRASTLGPAAGAALLVLAGCGSGSGSSSGSTTTGSIHVASTSLGQVLVDGAGRTLYLLTADGAGRSTCNRQCLTYWPPVAPPSTTTLPGISAAVGSTTTPDGQKTATVGGRPLYTYALDHTPGDVAGQGVVSFGGTWWAVTPDGSPVTAAPAPSRSPSSSGSSYGTGY